jgi:hypothetical protein
MVLSRKTIADPRMVATRIPVRWLTRASYRSPPPDLTDARIR